MAWSRKAAQWEAPIRPVPGRRRPAQCLGEIARGVIDPPEGDVGVQQAGQVPTPRQQLPVALRRHRELAETDRVLGAQGRPAEPVVVAEDRAVGTPEEQR
jgi:hypothetical protein